MWSMYKGIEVNFSKPKQLPEIDIKSQFNITSPMLQSTKVIEELQVWRILYDIFYRMYVNCSGPGFALHSDIVMPYISNYGTPEQIEKFLPRMTAGTCIGAIGMTEPGAGRFVWN